MPEWPTPSDAAPVSGTELLLLGRRDRAEARRKLGRLSVEEQASACSELRAEVRSEFLMLCDRPEDIVPLLPEADFVHTIRSGGMSEASWLLELASPPQLVACFDLDCWDGHELNPSRIREWIDALIEAGRPSLMEAMRVTDLELWLIAFRAETQVFVVGKEDEPPDGAFTPDGVVYFGIPEGVSPHRVHEAVHAAFERDQPLYWRLVYGLLFESPADVEEHALRWRVNRLQDLGFPDREQAMRVYRSLRAESAPGEARVEHGGQLVRSFSLPKQLRGSLLGEALSELPSQVAADALGYVLGVANSIAVADKLQLSDPDSVPRALEKAVRGIDTGLRELARVRGLPPHEVLEQTTPLDLFRTGATLEPQLRGPYRG
ncbi:MAG: DUF6178 family protein [Myxococcota bacterium]